MRGENNTGREWGKGTKTLLIVLGLFVLTLGATAAQIALKAHQQRPLFGNVVALTLLNINILLLLVLMLLIGRQLVKFYFERKESRFGAGFRTKLILAFVGLSVIPAAMLFFVASTMLSGGVKFWFGPKVENTVKNSVELVESYRDDRKASALHFADVLAERLSASGGDKAGAMRIADTGKGEFGLDMVEVYAPDGKLVASSGGSPDGMAGQEFIVRAMRERRLSASDTSGEREVVRGAAVFAGPDGKPAGLVVTGMYLSPGVSENAAEIAAFSKEYRNLRTFKNPLKESYMLSFGLVTLVIVFAALWFGLYMSKGITVPISTLAEATHRISRGEYDFQVDIDATDEIGVLVDSFRRMTRDLKESRERVEEANLSLSRTNALLEHRSRFIETVIENVNTGVMTIDRAGKVGTANRAAIRILAAQPGDVIGRNYRDVFEFHQLEDIREWIRGMADGGAPSIERDVQLNIARRTLNLRLFISTLHDVDGGYLGILVVFDDLTELIKAQRAAAWREVARRIAHEVKNPLTPIKLSAQRLRKRYLDGTGDYEKIIGDCTETIITQVESMKTLVDEFSKFARMPEAQPRPDDLHAVLDEAVHLYEGAHKDIVITRTYADGMPVMNLDREQMKRALINMLENAVSALEGSGKIWITTAYEAESGTARIEVADDGPGILPEDREKLFQPYFSKNKSGTGLGLAIVDRIVSDHGGYIRVEGNQPKGAKFVIELPVGR
ncbi:MAG: PAS domain S-box protein [Nitrospirae bacterium]|nr:PAS domain S-box protein [Nitrospirota bacterium]